MLNVSDKYHILSTEITEIGRFKIVLDTIEQDQNFYPYSYVKMKRGVGVLAFAGNNVILIRQYRYIWNKWMWEIPGGMVEDDEEPEHAAVRELQEETGFLVKEIRSLGICFPSIGSTTEQQFLFLADCETKKSRHPDPLESISVHLISIPKFIEMIKDNEFCHGMGLAAWGKYISERY